MLLRPIPGCPAGSTARSCERVKTARNGVYRRSPGAGAPMCRPGRKTRPTPVSGPALAPGNDKGPARVMGRAFGTLPVQVFPGAHPGIARASGDQRKVLRRRRADRVLTILHTRSDPWQASRMTALQFLEHLAARTDLPAACVVWPFSSFSNGYGQVHFRGHNAVASRVVCILTHGEPPTSKHDAAHSCGNGKAGCVHPAHVSWKTSSANQIDKRDHGRDNRGSRNINAKLTEATVRKIKKARTSAGLSELFGVSPALISMIRSGKRWTHV